MAILLIQYFCIPLFFKSYPEIDQPQSAGKESLLCNVSVSFSSKSKAANLFPKHILKSKPHEKSIHIRKKLFYHEVLKNYLCNVLCVIF